MGKKVEGKKMDAIRGHRGWPVAPERRYDGFHFIDDALEEAGAFDDVEVLEPIIDSKPELTPAPKVHITECDAVIAMYKRGRSIKYVCNFFDLSTDRVYQCLDWGQVELRGNRAKGKKCKN